MVGPAAEVSGRRAAVAARRGVLRSRREVSRPDNTPYTRYFLADILQFQFHRALAHHVMHALGFTITNVTERREPVLSDQPVWCRILNRWLDPGPRLA